MRPVQFSRLGRSGMAPLRDAGGGTRTPDTRIMMASLTSAAVRSVPTTARDRGSCESGGGLIPLGSDPFRCHPVATHRGLRA